MNHALQNGSRVLTTLVSLAALLSADAAYCATPVLSRIMPRGVQRGKEVDVVFNGGRMADAQEILFHDTGFDVVKLEAADKQVKVRMKIAADCRLGEHAARVRTATGISEFRTFFVGAYPELAEKEPNTDFDAPQEIPFNVTVAGVIQREDVDYFVVSAKKGERLTAEIEGMRLANTMFDPSIAILDMKRFELASVDDSALLWQDGAASIVVPEDGKYVIKVREAAYRGDGNCMYRLHVGHFPRPTAVYPAGGKAGEEIEVKFIGDPTGEFTQKFKLPAEPSDDYSLLAAQGGLVAPSPNAFRVSTLANVLEAEPNDDLKQGTRTEQAIPLAFNGIIAGEGDVDCFRFQAKKGQQFDVRCYARQLRSQLDPVLNVYDANGRGLAGNDDSGGPDSYFRFKVPADGEYAVRVTDHLGGGGPDYTYRVEFTPLKPTLTVSIPKFRRYSQERHFIAVPRGNRFATIATVSRSNFGGDVVMEAEGLPKGVALSAETMPANLNVVPLLFEAAPDAPIAGGWGNLVGRHADPKQNIRGTFRQSYEMVRGRPGQSIYWWYHVDKLAFAVTEEVPFKISLVEPKVPLVQNGSMYLKVVAERQEGFKAPITLQMPFRPPGVGAANRVTIPEGKNEALYQVNANSRAQTKKWKIVIIAEANTSSGPAWVSTQLATLEVAPPYVNVALQMTATEQGQAAEVVGKVQTNTPFEGKAKIKLVGLPAKVTAPDIEIAKDAKEVVFPLTVDKTSPVGQHKTLFCQLVITHENEPILHNLSRGAVLRIDAPPPPKKDVPKPQTVAKKPVAAPKKPVERRLSRLEKLRLEQAERLKQSQSGGGK